eukprot:73556-Ditylum_brightwellii.AAC.1
MTNFTISITSFPFTFSQDPVPVEEVDGIGLVSDIVLVGVLEGFIGVLLVFAITLGGEDEVMEIGFALSPTLDDVLLGGEEDAVETVLDAGSMTEASLVVPDAGVAMGASGVIEDDGD